MGSTGRNALDGESQFLDPFSQSIIKKVCDDAHAWRASDTLMRQYPHRSLVLAIGRQTADETRVVLRDHARKYGNAEAGADSGEESCG